MRGGGGVGWWARLSVHALSHVCGERKCQAFLKIIHGAVFDSNYRTGHLMLTALLAHADNNFPTYRSLNAAPHKMLKSLKPVLSRYT